MPTITEDGTEFRLPIKRKVGEHENDDETMAG